MILVWNLCIIYVMDASEPKIINEKKEASKKEALINAPFSRRFLNTDNKTPEYQSWFIALAREYKKFVENEELPLFGGEWKERSTEYPFSGIMKNRDILVPEAYSTNTESVLLKSIFLVGYEMKDRSYLFVRDIVEVLKERNFLNTKNDQFRTAEMCREILEAGRYLKIFSNKILSSGKKT
jgi:hypothetical protein